MEPLPSSEVLCLPTLLGVGIKGTASPGQAAGEGGAHCSAQGLFHFWQCHGLWCLCPFEGNFVVMHKRGRKRPYVLCREGCVCGPFRPLESLSHTPEAKLGPSHSLPGTLSPPQDCCFADPVFYLIFVTFILYTVNRSF